MIVSEVRSRLEELSNLCREYDVECLELFGSATREDFDPERSDIDFLVRFKVSARYDVVEQYFGLLSALEALFRRRVDLVDPERVTNPIVKRQVRAQRQALYVA